MSAPTPAFSASQIARASGLSKRKVLTLLAKVKADRRVIVSANETDGWCVTSLPEAILQRIHDAARQLGFRSLAEALTRPVEPWTPGCALNELRDRDIEFAQKLRTVLRPYLETWSNPDTDRTALRQKVVKEFCAVMGRATISERQIDNLATLVSERDRGLEQFDRLEIYLPKAFQKKTALQPIPTARGGSSVETLSDAINAVEDGSCPTPADRSMVWRAAVETYFELIDGGSQEKAAKRQIREHCSKFAPWMASSEESFTKGLNKKIGIAEKQGLLAIQDARKLHSGRRKKPDFAKDVELLIKIARRHDGNIALAHRFLYVGTKAVWDGNFYQFSEEYRQYFRFDPRRNKSYVPESIRIQVAPLIKATNAMARGPKAARLARASFSLDWSGVMAGDEFGSDDETANHYVWDAAPDGRYIYEGMRFNIYRPQLLPLIDSRTDYPLSLLVLSTPTYNSRHIRELIVQTCLDPRIGLPFQAFLFENGIWKAKTVEQLVAWSSVMDGFANNGIVIRRSNTPKSKPIERAFGAEQEIASSIPGYCGRDEKADSFEGVRRAIAQMRRADQPLKAEVDPRKHFLSKSQYSEAIADVWLRFASEPQNGKKLQGLSPAEGWQQLHRQQPHQVLPPSLEYLLATEESLQKVTHDGLKIRINGEHRFYFDSFELGRLIGRKVKVRFNPKFPDHVIVSDPVADPQGLRPFVVGVAHSIPAREADAEDFAIAKAQRSRFAEAGRDIFKIIDPKITNRTLSNARLGTEEQRAAGEALSKATTDHVEIQAKRKKLKPKARELSSRIGADTRGIPEEVVIEELGNGGRWNRSLDELIAVAQAEEFLASGGKSL